MDCAAAVRYRRSWNITFHMDESNSIPPFSNWIDGLESSRNRLIFRAVFIGHPYDRIWG